ncbi:MAG: D-2-hydroxyacid dehydrogenase [Pseudomonadota bacterium]
MTAPFPDKASVKICFAHRAYDFKTRFDAETNGLHSVQVTTERALEAALPTADVLVASGLWSNDFLDRAHRLQYLQSVSAGTNQYDLEAFRAHGVRLASGRGVNANAASEHAIGLLLSLTRRLALARDDQRRKRWSPGQRGMPDREEELPGKTMIVIGMGGIGDRIARLARALDMYVIGFRRDTAKGPGAADEVHTTDALKSLLPAADVVVISCPLTDDTNGLIDAEALWLMKPSAYLINVGRGACIDETALVDALGKGHLAGAGLDVTAVEPLPRKSPLWSMPNVVLTPHSAGETRRYEENVLQLLYRNLDRLWAGETTLINQIT